MLIKMRVSNQLETLTTHPRREARLVSKESLCDSYGNLGFDGRVVRIGEEMKVLRREIEDALAVRDSTARQRNSREGQRSEEHTSELQSLMRISYDVVCLKNKPVTTRT